MLQLSGWFRRSSAAEADPAEPPRSAALVNEARSEAIGIGLSLVIAVAGASLLLVAVAHAASRAGAPHGHILFWSALTALVSCTMAAVASRRPTRAERACLLSTLGIALYGVKVLRDPFAFTFADEFVHLANANAVVQTTWLFDQNSILPVTPLYPGLETLTSAVASLGGIDTFAAGLIVIGAGRLLLVLSLFILVERLSGSARVGSIAAVAYTANPNFVFFNAQYAYESLALPLLIFTLAALAVRRVFAGSPRVRVAWSSVALLGMCGVVVTHHMTSYALIGFLALIALSASVLRDHQARDYWMFVVAAAGATTAWLVFVASATVGYLSPVLSRAIASTFDAISREGPTRQLLISSADSAGDGGGSIAWERPVAVASVVLLLIAVPLGVRLFWQRLRFDPIGMTLAILSLAYFLSLGGRFVPAAWETANRAASFLFLGVSFAVALAIAWGPRLRRGAAGGLTMASVAFALVFAGGMIAGWPQHLRLSHPYRIATTASPIEPQGKAAAEWVKEVLGREARVATDDSNARLLIAHADAFAIAGRNPDVEDILRLETLDTWMIDLLAEHRLRYIVVDRRRVAFDNMLGYYFTVMPRSDGWSLPTAEYRKFDHLAVSRLFDSGTIAIYDVESLLARPQR